MNIQTDPARLRTTPVPVPGPVELPIRGAFSHEGNLRKLGASLARGEATIAPAPGAIDVRGRAREAAREILTVVEAAGQAQQDGEPITPAAQWLLDNHYLVEDTILQVRRDLPRRFYNRLPTIVLPTGERVPRVLAIAWLYVAHADSLVSLPGFEAMVEGFQEVEPLKIGELWALPSVLRFVLIENLRRLALRVDRARRMRKAANGVADQILATRSDDDDVRILERHADHASDTTFATQLLFRLRDGSRSTGRALAWLETELERSGSDAEEITLSEHATLSSGNVTTGNIVRGLRLINDIEWTGFFEKASRVDALLREATNFSRLDFASRDQYRLAIEELAKRSVSSETDVARTAIDMAKAAGVDIGFLLVGERRAELESALGYKLPASQSLYRFWRELKWVGIVGPTLVFSAFMLSLIGGALSGVGVNGWPLALMLVLSALPVAEAALAFFNTIVSLTVKPSRLVGYDYKDGVPEAARTLVVVPTLVGSRDDVEDALRNLEVHYLANMHGDLHFALLSDWPDSSSEQTAGDVELLAFARDKIAELNRAYPRTGAERFHLLHRRRLYNEAEGCWMGWERKRGKLHELNSLLRGDRDTTFLAPETPLPDGVRYVMTVDADTRSTRGAVAKLAGKLDHPLNRPVFDAKGRMEAGHAILQPRVSASLTTGDEASFFQRVFSSNRGMDPYVFAVSDTYQDLFGEGSFTGKGLYDVDAMEKALDGRIPENAVLSHDLLEGAYCRSALASDVELVEDYPTRYSVDASRHHRWARGDWQLLGYVFDPRSGVPGLSRWKMIDNLRRSLTPILWVMASIAGWTLLPVTLAAQFQALLILLLFFGLTFDVVNSLFPSNPEVTPSGHFASTARDAAFASAQVALRIIFIAHVAWSMLDAILRTLHRLFVSRRKLLEWRTASQAAKSGANTAAGYYRSMWAAPAIGFVGLAIPLTADSTGAWVAAFFSLLWVGSPAVALLVSRSAETEDRLEVAPDDAETLRAVARKTWLYFETFVTEEHQHLPPDNFQETPEPVVAARTSPTNIGVYLLSVISARDFGWLGLSQVAGRLGSTLSSLERMERFRGHYYNWYETRSLRPLLPLYISSVDSGNLAGHLLAVSAACRDWAEAPAAHLQGDFLGIVDATRILGQALESLPDDRRSLRPLRRRLQERIAGMRRAVETLRNEPETSAIRTINLTVLSADITKLANAIHDETKSARSEDLALWAGRLAACCEAHFADSHYDSAAVEALRKQLAELSRRARQIAFDMDFSFLLRQDRKLLSIGYRVAEHQLDEACYDLLASEARLTSLFAIAKGDVPTEHWFRLGRPITEIGFRGALVSWSGSMFEYLMPPLVMKEPQGGILNQTSRLIVRKQRSYGRAKRIPWGISESAYNGRDREMTYQYTNFGVPGLGLKRGLGQNLVVAPYATILAAQFDPGAAVANLLRLKAIGAMGRYGFHDAVDYTPARLPAGSTRAVVHNYMAHHHGMSIVAIANVVFEGRMRDRFHSDPVIEAAELLLQEKAPRDIPATSIRAEAGERVQTTEAEHSPDTRLVLDPARAIPAINLMSNGHYSVMVSTTGSGYSRLDDLAVTRWTADPTADRNGTFLFLTDADSGDWWSATHEPKQAAGEMSEALFRDDIATFVKTVGTLRSQVECIVVSEGNGEARRLTLWNDGTADRQIDVTSYAEVVLSAEASDAAHPAFSKMFVKTAIEEDGRMIRAVRQPRNHGEPTPSLAHFVTTGPGVTRAFQAETDRRAFIGRGRSIANAAAFDRGATLSGAQGFTLDPAMAIRCRLKVPAGKKVSLTYWTIAGHDPEALDSAIQRCGHAESFQRQAMMAWTRSQVQTRHVGLPLAEAAGVQKLARHLIYPNPVLRAAPEVIAAGLGPQSALWPTSISGDFPILALRIGDVADLEIIASALRMQEYLRARGLLFDLVVVNEQASSYVQDLQQAIEFLCESGRLRGRELGPRQHIFAVRRDLMDDVTYKTLIASARVVLHTRNGTILDQVERAEATQAAERVERQRASAVAAPKPSVPARPGAGRVPANGDGLTFWNGYGGFDDDGRDYVVRLAGETVTPHPWINVISNSSFGFHTSAEGASFTWSRNSRDFQLTPWSNDPVTNRPGEGIYLHDLDSGRSFSPFACLLPDAALYHEARHARGMSSFETRDGQLTVTATQLVDPEQSVKLTRLIVRNVGTTRARLRVYAYAEWVMGTNRARSAPCIVPGFEADAGFVTARNPYSTDYGDRVTFLASDRPADSATADRKEFLGQGSSERPAAVIDGRTLAGVFEAGRDPCAAIARDVVVEPGGETSVTFLLGDAGSIDEARALVADHGSRDFEARIVANRQAWDTFSGTLQVQTPDKAFDAMVNTWLPYQSVACRIRARSAFYQASGAFGFRDQLQDTLALLLHDPSLARGQILNAASRQFREGDVQHWWLPRTGAGVRTLISDDVVWLAYGTHRYVDATGDNAILDESLAFIDGQRLAEGQHDAFFTPEKSDEVVPLYEHCARALDLAIERTAASGLPLILGGDWNDGMNRVGAEGKGDSVWLGWFLLKTLGSFAGIATIRGDQARARKWKRHAEKLKKALENSAWDGAWYRRGSFDDGTPLGSATSNECRIDSIAQSWSVLSGEGDPHRSQTAMNSAWSALADHEHALIQLFDPPFEKTAADPGYIRSYPPGVRENGGQYTHAACWFVYALAEMGRADLAWQAFSMLNPVNHATDRSDADRYRVEPYVVAADVYAGGDKAGRGGWTWYTGSAGWLYRTAVEAILGIRREGGRLHIRPCLPPDWDGFSATLRIDGCSYSISVSRGAAKSVLLDGKPVDGGIAIGTNGTHVVDVVVPREAAGETVASTHAHNEIPSRSAL